MTEAVQAVLNQVLKLTAKERAALAAGLLASLDRKPELPGGLGGLGGLGG